MTKGILFCGTGIGISMAANRFPHIELHCVQVLKWLKEQET